VRQEESEHLSTKQDDAIAELSKKLDLILRRLSALEDLIVEKPEYEGVLQSLRLTKFGVGLYDEPLKIATRLRRAERVIARRDVPQDAISRCIIQALAVRGPLNISALAREVQSMRGTASRRIIRDRLKDLEGMKIVQQVTGFGKMYELTMWPAR
jgi:hypothetical protein